MNRSNRSGSENMTARSWKMALRTFFDLPASVIMLIGEWKVGKTDCALKIGEDCLRIGIINKLAGNIEVFNEPRGLQYRHISDLATLKRWMFADRQPKMYIYDEALTGTPKRRAMSGKNVDLAFNVVPQLSKGRGKLLVITQTEEYMDSVFFNPVFLKGVIIKETLDRAVFRTPRHSSEIPISGIPKTSFKFDPYSIATLRSETQVNVDDITDENLKILVEYSKSMNLTKIGRKHKMYPQQIKRIIQRGLRDLLIKDQMRTTPLK